MNLKFAIGALCGATCLTPITMASAQEVQFLGGTLSQASDTSANGSVTVGVDSGPGYATPQAWIWTLSGGKVYLGELLGSTYNQANAVSADGTVVVGFTGSQAFLWTQGGGAIGLGYIGGSGNSTAQAVSANGTVVAGNSNDQAFRWTQATGMVGLGFLGFANHSTAQAVSADGSVVVGEVSGVLGIEPYRWSQATGMVGLGYLPGGNTYGIAQGASSNGSIVVGTSYSGNGVEAFRWTQATGMVGLGDLPGGSFVSGATAITPDGSVIVGVGTSDIGQEAFYWTQADGMRTLASMLTASGVDLSGHVLRVANTVSDDGRVVAGYTTDIEAFWARLSTPSTGCLNSQNSAGRGKSDEHNRACSPGRPAGLLTASTLNASLQSMSNQFALGLQSTSLNLSDVLDSARLSDGDRAVGSTAAWSGPASLAALDGRSAGVTYQATSALRIGVSGTQAGGEGLGFAAHNQGSMSAFAALAPREDGLRLQVAMSSSHLVNTTSRSYSSGPDEASSNGEGSGEAYGAALNIGWALPMTQQVTLTPFAGYEAVRIRQDAYTEYNGAFPAHFNDAEGSVQTLHVGAELRAAVGGVEAWASGGWAHRVYSDLGELTGYLLDFAAPFSANPRDIGDAAEVALGATWRTGSRSEMDLRLRASDDDITTDVSASFAGRVQF